MMSQVVVVIMIVVVLFIVVSIAAPSLWRDLSERLKHVFKKKKITEHGEEATHPGTPHTGSTPQHTTSENHSYIGLNADRGTLLLPQLAVEQLDVRCKRVVHTFFVCDIPESGISISRPDADEKPNDIRLIGNSVIARSVSGQHLSIGYDSKGFFWVNKDGNVQTMYNKVKTACHDIKDGDVLYLGSGRQPIRFRILDSELYSELLEKLNGQDPRSEEERRAANTTLFYNGGAPASDLRRRFRQMGGQG